MKNPFLVGLAGGSASGKTTLITALQKHFDATQLCVISLDHYYKPLSQQKRDENGFVNFDDPEGIDFKRVNRDINKLHKGEEVSIVEYTFNNPDRFPRQLKFIPAPIVLVEGIFVYYNKTLKNKFDWRLWIDAPVDLALERRLKRDQEERGMTREEIEYQWVNHVLPAREQHLDPHKKDVHMVLDNHDHFEEGLNAMVERFEEELS